MRRSLWLLLVLPAVVVAGLAVHYGPDKLRHLAIPTFGEVEPAPATAAHPLVEQLGTEVEHLAQLGRRLSAVAMDPDGTLWVGLFDGGVAMVRPGEEHPRQLTALVGRERFVTALVPFRGHVFAGTYGGIFEFDAKGKLVARHLEGVPTDGLVLADAKLIAGTARGAFVLGEGGFTLLDEVTDGESVLRITALDADDGRLWFGTPRGAYLLEGGKTRWLPLVFGQGAASTNVVTATVAVGAGAILGTDNGGLVWASPDGTVQAARFDNARANEINPGASARLRSCAVFGTQGAGLLVASARSQGAVARLGPSLQVSAVAIATERVLIGTEDGEVLALRLPSGLCPDAFMVSAAQRSRTISPE